MAIYEIAASVNSGGNFNVSTFNKAEAAGGNGIGDGQITVF